MTPESRSWVSTGVLPSPAEVQVELEEAYERHRRVDEGMVADYIPALARTRADLFGVCIAGVSGQVHAVGDAAVSFTVQSVSKPFMFALVCDQIGVEDARDKLGANATGLSLQLRVRRRVEPGIAPPTRWSTRGR